MCTTTVIAYEYKRLLSNYAVKTGADLDLVSIQGHDFGARGMSCMEDAAQSGVRHLTLYGHPSLCKKNHHIVRCSAAIYSESEPWLDPG